MCCRIKENCAFLWCMFMDAYDEDHIWWSIEKSEQFLGRCCKEIKKFAEDVKNS